MPNKYDDEINGIIERTKMIKKYKNLTVSEWFSVFLNDYCKNIKMSTLASYQQAVTNHIDMILGDVLLEIWEVKLSNFLLTFSQTVILNGSRLPLNP